MVKIREFAAPAGYSWQAGCCALPVSTLVLSWLAATRLHHNVQGEITAIPYRNRVQEQCVAKREESGYDP